VSSSKPVIAHLLAGGAVITANRRLSRSYNQAYREYQLASGATVWDTPLIVPFDAWLLRLHGELLAAGEVDFRVLDRAQSELIWLDALNTVSPSQTGLFLNKAKSANGLANAWQCLSAWQQDPGQPPESLAEFKYTGNDTKLFLRVAKQVVKEQQKQKLCDPANLADALISCLGRLANKTSAAQVCERFPSLEKPLLVSGHLRLDPQQRRFIEAISKGQQIDVLHPGDTGSSPAEEGAGGKIYKAEFASSLEEWRTVAMWCRTLLESPAGQAQPSPLKIGVVIPELAESRAQILRVFDREFFPANTPREIEQSQRPYDIGLGNSLAEWPLVQAALLLLELKIDSIDAPGFSHLLLSPYIAGAVREHQRRLKFDRQIRSAGLQEVTIDTLLPNTRMPLGFRDVLERLQKVPLEDATLAVWCKRFSDLLKSASWPGGTLGSHEYQCFEAWQDALRGLARLGTVTGRHSAATALSLLKRLVTQRLFQPETAELPVQLLAPADSIGLEFTHLWVCGMDAMRLPGPVKADPWLPRNWQKQVGVPGSSAQVASEDAQKLLAAWLNAAPQILFSYSAERDGQEMQAAAALTGFNDIFADLQTEEGASVLSDWVCLQQDRTDAPKTIRAALELSSVADSSGRPIADGEAVKGGARFFEEQAQCPFRAYVNHRLRAKSLEEATVGLDARLRGNVLHHAMQHFWERVKTREALVQLIDSGLDTVIDDCVQIAFHGNPESAETDSAETGPTDQANPKAAATEAVTREENRLDINNTDSRYALLELEKNRLRDLLKYWLCEKEVTRPDFTVVSVEETAQLDIQGMLFTLQVDRLDELASGEQVVLDYKTGTGNKPGAWMKPRPQNPQLPLYSVLRATGENPMPVDALAFAEVNRAKPSFAGIGSSKELIPGGVRAPTRADVDADEDVEGLESESERWEKMRELWDERIATLAGEIKKGHAIVDPQPDACRYCDLASVCRIDPQHLEDVVDETENGPDAAPVIEGAT